MSKMIDRVEGEKWLLMVERLARSMSAAGISEMNVRIQDGLAYMAVWEAADDEQPSEVYSKPIDDLRVA